MLAEGVENAGSDDIDATAEDGKSAEASCATRFERGLRPSSSPRP